MNLTHPFIELQNVDSTNLYAEQLLKKQRVPEGTVIIAHEQTSGKGQGDNKWESEPGKNATFSLILFPGFLHPGQQFLLNKTVSLGVLDFISRLKIEQKCSIKWPNDIYAGDRKIGGILIQNTICGIAFESCIAGIGVNINQEIFHACLQNPVSLKQIIGKDYPVKDAVDIIINCIDERYQQLEQGVYETIDQEYRKLLLGIDEWRDYVVDKKVIKGKIRDVNEIGMLMMEMENGSIQSFNHGEIEFFF